MLLPEALRIIHEPARLRIMGVLARSRIVRLADLARALELTDGNVLAHVRRLEEVGYVSIERRLDGGLHARVGMTPRGSAAFDAYVRELRSFLENVGDAT